MREILFRGKSGDKWIYGYYLFVKEQNKHYILTGKLASYSIDCSHSNLKTNGFEWFEVDPETVGQYTGLKDKNGNRIYEGDIIKCAIEDPCTGKIDRFYNCYVKYCKTTNAMGWYCIDERKVLNKIPPQQDYVEIIGNIHDNKDLIGE